MPKYRKLHTCTLDSLDLAAMPDDFTRLTWLMFPLILSREGTTLDHSHYLRSKLFPLRTDVSEEMVARAVQWFKERGMAQNYTVSDRNYLWFPSFTKYQGNTEREGASTFPPPPAELVNSQSACNSQDAPEPVNSQPTRSSHDTPELVVTNSGSQVDTQVNAQVDADADSATGACFKAWQEARGGAINALDAEQVGDLVDEYSAEWVTEAIKEANLSRQDKIVSLAYVRAILERWKREGFKTPRGGKKTKAREIEWLDNQS